MCVARHHDLCVVDVVSATIPTVLACRDGPGVPVFAKAARSTLAYDSPWLMAALGCAVFILILGAAAFVRGRVTTFDPSLVHAGALDSACTGRWEFQHWTLARASESWAENRRRLEWKGAVSDSIAVVLLVELACMIAWIVLG